MEDNVRHLYWRLLSKKGTTKINKVVDTLGPAKKYVEVYTTTVQDHADGPWEFQEVCTLRYFGE